MSEITDEKEPKPKISQTEDGSEHRISRRQFLYRVAGTSAAVGALAYGGYLIHDAMNPVRQRSSKILEPRSFVVPSPAGFPRNVMVHGPDPLKNLDAALKRLGGLEAYIRKGDRVLIKPNIAWDRTAELAANTNPAVVEAMVRLCFRAGARSVIVGDHSVNDPGRCAEASGIKAAALKAKGKFFMAKKDSDFVEAKLEGRVLMSWPVLKLLYEVDKVINMPAAKHHRLSRVTLGIKNWLGIVGGQRSKLHQNIHLTIVDLIVAFPPTLTVIDASRILMSNGPTGGRQSDVLKSDVLVAGVDAASVDGALLPLLKTTPSEVRHVTEAVKRGMGSLHEEAVDRFSL